jgi:hypothetical protein
MEVALRAPAKIEDGSAMHLSCFGKARDVIRRTVLAAGAMAVSIALVGCGAPAAPVAHVAAAPATAPSPIARLIELSPGALVVNLDVYQLSVPVGAITGSEPFWKHVEEERIDPATKDLLQKNGVRVGIAPDSDWDYFKEILENNNAKAIKGSVMAGETGMIELPMKKDVGEQTIFILSDEENLAGRNYTKCENLLSVSFWPDARHTGSLHVTVAPIVRSLRSHLEIRANGEEHEIVEVRPEQLYDLNLRTEIPPNCFLVMAPSPNAKYPTSVGDAFLINSEGVERKETIVILAPKSVRRVENRPPRKAAPDATPTVPAVH